MKLKKIASMMLAGVMAVSMLAGCSTVNNGGDDTNGVKPPVDDVTPASYSQTILDGTSSDTKSIMTAKDSDMLTAAVVAAGESVNEFDDIHDLIKVGAHRLNALAYHYGKDNTCNRMLDGFGDNLAEDVNLVSGGLKNTKLLDYNDRDAALYVCDTSMNDTQINNAISSQVNTIMKGLRDHINATDIDYTLSVAKVQVGTRANGVILVGIMVETVGTHAA